MVGDIFTVVVLYQGYEAYRSHTILVEGGWTQTIVLTAVITAPSLKLYTVQEFLDYFNFVATDEDSENGVRPQQVVKIGQMVEKAIESDTNTVFDNNAGDYYAKTEFIDTDENQNIYFVKDLPVNSVTSLYTTQNDAQTTPDYDNNTSEWTSLTEGTDFVIEKGDDGIGRIQITNGSYRPISRRWGLYVVYLQGRTSVPSDIKMLAIVETGLRMLGATFIKDRIKKVSDIDIPDLSHFSQFRKRILGQYTSDGLNTVNT